MEKNLVVFDYDNSLHPDMYTDSINESIFRRNLESIKRYQQHDGNYFMIATARPYDSIMERVDKYHIKPDFISCMRGYSTYYGNGEIMNTSYISEDQELDLEAIELMRCVLDVEELTHDDKIICYFIAVDVLRSKKELRNIIKEKHLDLRNYIHTYLLKGYHSNKVTSIELVRNYLDIDKKHVYTFGDATADREMIQSYNGYTTITPLDIRLFKDAIGCYIGAYKVVDKITQNKAKVR